MSTLPQRVRVDAEYEGPRIMQNPNPDGCCALVKLGARWPYPIHCSHRHKPNSLFCGTHDHLNALFGDMDGWMERAFRTRWAKRHGLRFPAEEVARADEALRKLWRSAA